MGRSFLDEILDVMPKDGWVSARLISELLLKKGLHLSSHKIGAIIGKSGSPQIESKMFFQSYHLYRKRVIH